MPCTGLDLPGDLFFSIIYTDTSVVLKTETVPEPSTYLLLASGLAGLMVFQRWRARRARARE